MTSRHTASERRAGGAGGRRNCIRANDEAGTLRLLASTRFVFAPPVDGVQPVICRRLWPQQPLALDCAPPRQAASDASVLTGFRTRRASF